MHMHMHSLFTSRARHAILALEAKVGVPNTSNHHCKTHLGPVEGRVAVKRLVELSMYICALGRFACSRPWSFFFFEPVSVPPQRVLDVRNLACDTQAGLL